jgi:hypothetical protein
VRTVTADGAVRLLTAWCLLALLLGVCVAACAWHHRHGRHLAARHPAHDLPGRPSPAARHTHPHAEDTPADRACVLARLDDELTEDPDAARRIAVLLAALDRKGTRR